MYIVNGVMKDAEEDSYKEGIIGGASFCTIDYTFKGETLEKLYENIDAFFGFGNDAYYVEEEWLNKRKNCLMATVLENEMGELASKGEKASWKMGKKKLWSATYTFIVYKTEEVDLEAEAATAAFALGG